MTLSQITSVGWCANMMLDRRVHAPFTFEEIYTAIDQRNFTELLLKIDDSGIIELWASNQTSRTEVEEAFANAASALEGREMRKAGIGDNPLCMIIALVLETIQQNFNSRLH